MDYTELEYEEPSYYPFSHSHVQFKMGSIIPCFPESHGLSLLFMWKDKQSRTEVVREGGSEEKRTRAVPASECHHEEGESE